ncbi:MAG: hypothetical protein WKF58_19395 [Ilumatobacteraceae bacterium]
MAGRAESVVRTVTLPLRAKGFPYRAPTVPHGVEVPEERAMLGADYDTGWARAPLPSAVRSVVREGPMRVVIEALTRPEVLGRDRIADLTRRADDATRTVTDRRR